MSKSTRKRSIKRIAEKMGVSHRTAANILDQRHREQAQATRAVQQENIHSGGASEPKAPEPVTPQRKVVDLSKPK